MHGPSLATLMVVATLGSVSSTTTPRRPDAVAEARRKLAQTTTASRPSRSSNRPSPKRAPARTPSWNCSSKAYESAAKQSQTAGTTRRRRDLPREPEDPHPEVPSSEKRHPSDPARFRAGDQSGSASDARTTARRSDSPDRTARLRSLRSIRPPRRPLSPRRPARIPSPESRSEAASGILDPEPAGLAARRPRRSTLDLGGRRGLRRPATMPRPGRIYTRRSPGSRKLPAERRDHWLYCRAFEVVTRINAQPRTEAEWASIKTEVEQIRSLNPSNWLGEYLRRTRRRSAMRLGKRRSHRRRSWSSEARPPRNRPSRRPSVEPAWLEPPRPSPPSAPRGHSSKVGAPVGRWQILDSANFRIYHVDPDPGGKVAQAAESTGRDQLKRWSNPNPEDRLAAALRDLSLSNRQAVRPDDRPARGFARVLDHGDERRPDHVPARINLRADHPTLVPAVLPHEITHVILADHFTEQQIPRWADEGDGRALRTARRAAAKGRRPGDPALPITGCSGRCPDEHGLSRGTLLGPLLRPERLAQTRFLVEQGSPAQMLQFLQESQREGYETALRRVYQIDGFADLQRRWLAYARA